MKFGVNYITEEVMRLSKPSDERIKYPGGKWDLETLRNLKTSGYKTVLHGIIPSSGSLFDPHLCDSIDEFSKIFNSSEQKWCSFHTDHKAKYDYACDFNSADDRNRIMATFEKNLIIIKEKMPNVRICIENMPAVDNIEDWCQDPEFIYHLCRKYDLYLLLDICHATISSMLLDVDPIGYMKRLPLDRCLEIHMAGLAILPDGKGYDAHIECGEEQYELLEKILPLMGNLEMITLEFSPSRDYDGNTVAQEYRKKHTTEELYSLQQKQLSRLKEIAKKCGKYSN